MICKKLGPVLKERVKFDSVFTTTWKILKVLGLNVESMWVQQKKY
jgi:hypothetical protein